MEETFTFKTHSSPPDIKNDFSPIYFSKSYIESQDHDQFVAFESFHFFVPIAVSNDEAISIPRSPFGSFLVKKNANKGVFFKFVEKAVHYFKNEGLHRFVVNHPANLYPGFVPEEWLKEAGFKEEYSEINQYIPISSEWEDSIHKMQKRKLISLANEGFEFRSIDASEVETAHQFISVCRQVQGLDVNISPELLKKLVSNTKAYDFFGVFRGNKMSAVCIAVRVTDKVAYYYLPATSPTFRNQSPMVLLIKGMVEYYLSLRFEFLDLGISSIKGKPQESLRVFKERMGGLESKRKVFTYDL